MVSQGQAAAIASPYVVGQQPPPPVGVKIPAGTPFPARYEGRDRVILARGENQSVPVTLKVAQNIVTNQGQVLIPAGSDVTGQLQTIQEVPNLSPMKSFCLMVSEYRLAQPPSFSITIT